MVNEKPRTIDDKRKSICLFCSLGCGVAFRTKGNQVVAIDYDRDNPVNHGSLCPRGHYNVELINHPQRLIEPMIGRRKVSWEEAISFSRQELRLFTKDEIGIVISAIASCEDAFWAAKLAKSLGVKNVSYVAPPFDLTSYQGDKWEVPGAERANLEEVENSEMLIIVGDLLTRSPVFSKRVNRVKYGKRGNKVVVIDSNITHTSWFATTHFRCQPGTEALVLAGLLKVLQGGLDLDLSEVGKISGIDESSIVSVAQDFARAVSGTILFVPSGTEKENNLIAYFVKNLASWAKKKYLICYQFGNLLGVGSILDQEIPEHISYGDLIKKIDTGEIKAMVVLGEDITGYHLDLTNKFKFLKFVLRSDFFKMESAFGEEGVVVLPQASQFESGGVFCLVDGRIERREAIVPKVGTKSIAEICASLQGEIFDEGSTREQVKSLLTKEFPKEKVELKEKVARVRELKTKEQVPTENITYFGNNRLVKNFFWYRVNN